jgi:hypothetical protein
MNFSKQTLPYGSPLGRLSDPEKNTLGEGNFLPSYSWAMDRYFWLRE